MNEKPADYEPSSGLLPDLIRNPVTGLTSVAAIVASVSPWLGYYIEPLLMNYRAFGSEPWRLLTSALPHADYFHLVFNIYWLAHFGKQLEPRLGRLRTAGLYALLAAGSQAAEYAVFDGGMGLSGVGYGLFGLSWVLSRRHAGMRGAVDQTTALIFVGWFFLCIVLTAVDIWSVANVAHGAGAILGGLVGYAWVAPPERRTRHVAAVVLTLLAVFVAATFARPLVNSGPGLARELSERAYTALQQKDYSGAADLYRRTLVVNEHQWGCWFNLGIAESKLGRSKESLAAFRRAYQLEPSDTDTKESLIAALRVCGREADSRQAYQEAADHYQELLRLDSTDAADWYELGRARNHLHDDDEALKAYREAAKIDPQSEKYRVALNELVTRIKAASRVTGRTR